jgi:1-acyl-sn-glycerol-3-phosphate acyltransferase
VARACAFVYYRVEYAGDAVPRRGPLLLVANHPNSLIDPVMVVAAARRPVRFLAKAPLFTDRKIGWLIRGAGSIPVYRRMDDGSQMARNREMFDAVEAALGQASAVGLFPEGMSHSEPSLAPLRTGAARIALGAAASTTGGAFPIVPVGLVFRDKDVFRSRALVLVGDAIEWDDLASRGGRDADAVRDLTDRITDALRGVTINLERWEDQPLIECALDLWEVDRGAAVDPAERIARLEITTRILAEARATRDPVAATLARDVESHRRRLRRLRLRPADLGADVSWARGRSWTARRWLLALPPVAVLALAGWALFRPPYRLTGWLVDRMDLEEDTRSTWKLLVGIVVYLAWVVALAIAAAVATRFWAGLLVLVLLPAIGIAGGIVRERWRGAWDDARRFFLLRTRHPLLDALRARQGELSRRLDTLAQARAVEAAQAD